MSDPDAIVLRVQLGHVGDDSLQLRFPPEHSDEMLSLLDDEGISHSTALELSADVFEWIEVVRVLGTTVAVSGGALGGLHGLAKVISAFAHRHDKKKIVVKHDDYEIELTGYSEKQVMSLLEPLPDKQMKLDAAIRKSLGRD
jgi:hypothetical protein